MIGKLISHYKILEQIGDGDLTADVNLRSTDQLKEVQGQLNNLIKSLDDRLGHIKGDLKNLESLIANKKDPDFVSKLNAKINHIQNAINHFKVTSDSKNQ